MHNEIVMMVGGHTKMLTFTVMKMTDRERSKCRIYIDVDEGKKVGSKWRIT
jgi:hypothetical protein